LANDIYICILLLSFFFKFASTYMLTTPTQPSIPLGSVNE